MPKAKSKSSKLSTKNVTPDGYAYLTKRTLISKAKAAGKKAADLAMAEMGYVIVEMNGWIVKKHSNGSIEPLSQI